LPSSVTESLACWWPLGIVVRNSQHCNRAARRRDGATSAMSDSWRPSPICRRASFRPSRRAARLLTWPSRNSHETFRCPGPNRKSSSASADPARLQPWQSSETANTRGSRRRSAPLNRPHASRREPVSRTRWQIQEIGKSALETGRSKPARPARFRQSPLSASARPAECGALRRIWRSLPIPRMRGWGGRIRTSGWRNQNPIT
jgi:hypothetical protein